MIDYVTFVYGFNLGYAKMLVEDLSAEQVVAQPGGVINHPAWSLGHLAVASNYLGKFLGLESSLPEGWAETFKIGGEPSGDLADYPPMDEILDELREQHARNAEAVKHVDAARFAEPHPIEARRNRFPTVGDQVVFLMTAHEMDHLGQLAAWRRAMGLGSALGV